MVTGNSECGKLALTVGRRLPLQVIGSRAGFYIGTLDEDGPISRESVEYWACRNMAEAALADRRWTQRYEP
jgi:hypothetical protein